MNFGKFIRKYSTDTENENSSNRTSIMSGTSKLFDSVNTRTTNLVSGLSNTFDQIKRRTSVESLSFTDKEQAKFDENYYKTKPISQTNTKLSGFENIENKLSYEDSKGFIEQTNQVQQDGQNNYTDANLNEDQMASSRKNPPPKPPPPSNKQISNPHEDEKVLNSEVFSRNQSVTERNYFDDVDNNEYFNHEGSQIANDVYIETKSHLELECQKIVSAMDDLISFDPINNLFPSNEDRNSSLSEYGEKGDQPLYAEKNIMDRPTSSSPESILEELNEQQKDFMDFFISDIYREGNAQNDEISQSKFNKCIQSRSGREWFVRLVEKYQYLNSKEVPETIFYRLLQTFTVILLECYEHDDFLPARDLMLVAFGCYTTLKTVNNHTMYNFYLSSFISCHPIWKSIQFWNVCFFNAVQEVRSKRSSVRRNSTNMSDADGVAFHQLQIHLNYMRSLGLPVELCSGFVTKQVDIVNLTDDEMRRLNDVMESWKE